MHLARGSKVPATLAAVVATAAMVGWLLLWSDLGIGRDAVGDTSSPAPTAAEAGSPVRLAPASGTSTEVAGVAAQRERVAAAEAPHSSAAPSQATLVVVLVLQDSGTPCSGCLVRLWVARKGSTSLSGIAEARTDAAGRCEINVPAAREFVVEGGPDGSDDKSDVGSIRQDVRPLAPGEQREIQLALPNVNDSDFWGRIVAEEGGEPLAGARIVRLNARDKNLNVSADGVPALATSAADGLFHVRFGSWSSSRELSIELAGFGPAFFSLERGYADEASALELRLRRSGTLALQVVGSTVDVGALLRAETDAYELAQPDGAYFGAAKPHWAAKLDEHMRVELELSARVPLRLELEVSGASNIRFYEALTLEPGERREIEWPIGGGAILAGRLVDQNDVPVANAELWLTRSALAGDARLGTAYFYWGDDDRVQSRVMADDEGRFRFDDVSSGIWWVGPMAEWSPEQGPDGYAPLATGIEILPGEARRDVLLRTWRGLAIQGLVLDPWGNLVPHEIVTARAATVGGVVEGSSDDDGAFALGPLVPGEYVLSAGILGSFAPAKPISVQAGATGVVLRLREAGVLQGSVVDRKTGAMRAAEVWVSSRGEGTLGGDSQDDGAFQFDGLEPGVYDIVATTNDGHAGILAGVEVGVGETVSGLSVEVDPGARLTVFYAGPVTYARFCIFYGDVPTTFDGLHTGTSATKVVPAGALRVELQTSEGRVETREITIALGEEAEVAFRFD